MTPIALTETIDFAEMTIVDGTVQQVLIRAGLSKNNRLYSEAVLQKAAGLFEGRQTYADHPSAYEAADRPERSIHGLTGWLTNARYEAGAVRATRHFTQNQAGKDAQALIMAVVNREAPATLIGASINALGTGKENEQGVLVVESLDHIFSVDDVTAPAAGGGWGESYSQRQHDLAAILGIMSYQEWQECRPDYYERLTRELKTIRQTKALTDAQVLAESLTADLEAVRDELQKVTATLEAERAQVSRLRTEQRIDRLLYASPLPEAWREDLRKQLLLAQPSEWSGIIENEIRKARSVRRPVPVRGGYQAVQAEPIRDPIALAREALARVRDVDEFERLIAGKEIP